MFSGGVEVGEQILVTASRNGEELLQQRITVSASAHKEMFEGELGLVVRGQLGVGAIVGIVVGSVLAAGLLTVLAVALFRKKSKKYKRFDLTSTVYQ